MAEFDLGEPIFEVLRKVSACVDDRHLKIMAEFDLGEPNFEVLRKVSACDDDRHFSKTLQFPHAGKVTHRRSGLLKLTQHSQVWDQCKMVTLRG